MASLAPSQSSRLFSCLALTQSSSLGLVSLKLKKTIGGSAQVFKTNGAASLTGVSRKSCTMTTFHSLFYSKFSLHMHSRFVRTSVGCSGSELGSDKAQYLAIKSISGHHSALSLSSKRGSVSLLGGCSTHNSLIINGMLLSFAARTLLFKHISDVLRSSAASHPGSRVSPARLVVNGPNFNCFWACTIITNEESSHLLNQSIPMEFHGSQLTTGLIILSCLQISEGFLGIYIMGVLLYHSCRMNCSVDSSTLLLVPSSSSTKERILLPCLLSVKGDDSSGVLPSVWFNLLAGLLPCVAVCTGPEGAIEITSVLLVGEGWLSTSQYKVTKSQLSDFVVHASSTHSSLVSNSLSSSFEELSCLIVFAIVAYVYFPRGCLIPSCFCSSSS